MPFPRSDLFVVLPCPQRSAALFQGLRGSPILQFLNHQSDADMGEQCLKLGSQLMLAQAQACFYELAHKRDMKPNVLAQLAMCTSDLYREAYNIVMVRVMPLHRLACVCHSNYACVLPGGSIQEHPWQVLGSALPPASGLLRGSCALAAK